MKLLTIGNILMEDDGIALHLVSMLEEKLVRLGIEVIYGETDIGYCITQICDGDELIIVDAADLGKRPGDISVLTYEEMVETGRSLTSHSIRFLDLLRLYYPNIHGCIIAIQAAHISFSFGPSRQLKNEMSIISQQLLEIIIKIGAKGIKIS